VALVTLSRDALLASYDWRNAKVRLEDQPVKIDLFRQIERLSARIDKLSGLCIRLSRLWAREAFIHVRQLRNEAVAVMPGVRAGIARGVRHDDGSYGMSIEWLPYDAIEMAERAGMGRVKSIRTRRAVGVDGPGRGRVAR
jgi:hypothetical protein